MCTMHSTGQATIVHIVLTLPKYGARELQNTSVLSLERSRTHVKNVITLKTVLIIIENLKTSSILTVLLFYLAS